MPTRENAWPQGTPCWVDCAVDDPDKASEFYSALFGWVIEEGAEDTGGYLMALRDGQSAAGLMPKPPGVQMPSAWTTYIAAESADDIAQKITAAGGSVINGPMDVLDIGRMLIAADTSGAVFGVWQAKQFPGAGIYNEHGAYCWNELHTHEYAKAQQFYAAVFDWQFTEIGDGQNFAYATFAVPSGGNAAGGVNDEAKSSSGGPNYWLTWFQVDDTDAAVAKASGLGAQVLMPVDDSPFGRMAVVQGPQGEVFGVIDPTRTVGTAPSGG
ncbi:VOC family protein [Skermania sp. ID1734]|uniref:VOC family protein n=1 Tax=Skermania sp. ID1734 TaxID=2597516 RepID=UPI0011807B00|nr:VOC family protein [Skermania sp. ID1734]TSE01413.1 VOC family protein [Skermania sp. ID1734]